MIYSWQTVNTGNLAEQVCRPTDYFDLGQPVSVIPQETHTMPDDGMVIFGASGLLYPEIAHILEVATVNRKSPLVAWGIGHNTHGGTKIEYPDWLAKFTLVGLRDYGTAYPYVPCPSCMHSAFDVDYGTPRHPVVIYDQFDYPVKSPFPGVPRENNFHPAEDMARIVSFLASGETIVTSSYHGAYWGMLLNRKVILWKPWSTKFETFKWVPPWLENEDYALCQAVNHPDYLNECRWLNCRFAEKVRRLLGTCNLSPAGVKSS